MKVRKPSVTVLLGAGASMPFLNLGGKPLSTKSITKAFRDNKRWRRICSLFGSEETRLNARFASKSLDLREALHLRTIADRFLSHSNHFAETRSFEPMIHLVDRASAFLQGRAPVNIMQLDACMPALFDGVHQSARNIYSQSNPDGWFRVPSLAREVVLDAILDAWEESSSRRMARAIQLHQDFYRQLTEEHEQVSIYSLNYDPLTFAALAPLGFATGFLDEREFNPSQFYQKLGSRRLAFLHGHVGLTLDHKGRTVFNRSYRTAQAARIKGIVRGGGTSVTQKGIHANALMITGLDKFEAFSRDPFSTYMLRFSRDVQEFEHLIIIGSSLGDNHLNTFLIHATTIDPRKKVIYVTSATPRAVLNATGKPSTSPRGQLGTLLSTLQASIRHAVLGQYWSALARDVGRQGYGKAADGLLLYAGGTEAFYRLGSTAPLFACNG